MQRWMDFAFVRRRYCWQQRRPVEGDVIAFMFYNVHCDDRGAQTGGWNAGSVSDHCNNPEANDKRLSQGGNCGYKREQRSLSYEGT